MHRRDTAIYRRGRKIKEGKAGGGPVVYWMSRDQRVQDHWGLLWAQQEAIIHERQLLVILCLPDNLPGVNPAQLQFMRVGIATITDGLKAHNIGCIVLKELPEDSLPRLIHNIDAHSLICDFNPVTHHKRCKDKLQTQLTIPFYEVDSHNVIPAWVASDKKEYAAYTIRPKIKRLLGDFLCDIPLVMPHPHPYASSIIGEHKLWAIPPSMTFPIGPLSELPAGQDKALAMAETFIKKRLESYDALRNDPCQNGQSNLSPYLHSGQLSAQKLARMVQQTTLDEEVIEPFLEELIVRRELSDNFCLYEDNYDNFDGFSNWAQTTLDEHRKDPREYSYSLETLEQGQTHEQLWNCCQLDLIRSGKLHGFLRMYWAKKILEWTKDPETALNYANLLNDKYSIDGNDPNGYTGVAWSVGGVHDRAWGERPVFGKIRYMNEKGCRRKFDVNTYINTIQRKA